MSPDDRYLAYTRVDESTVDIIPRYDIAAGETTVVEQRYPRAGRPNAIVDLFVRDMETGEVTEVSWRRDDWGPATDQYLTKVAWSQIANLHIQVSNRFQSEIRELTALGLRNWSALERPLKTQSSQTWVNLQPFGERGNRSHVWVTEETGFAALRGLFDEQPFVDRVGSENWSIDELLVWEALVPVEGSGVSGRTFIGIAHFTGFKDTPLERHLYRTDFRTGDISRITPLGSSWSITMAPDGKSFVGTSSSPDQPPQTGLYRADGTLIAWIEENALDETHPYFPYLGDHTVPEYGTLTAEDGQTLYYSIQTPPNFDPSQKYPVLVNVYGGPGVQTVDRDWERWDDQFYTRQGYIVFRLDNRGTANRGKAFEDVIYRQMGIPEVRDQLLGVEWLKSQPFVDSGRIAIQGWSYGGYMTLMTMLQAEPGTFAAAVSGAPVTDWALYDTFYTERYMDTPEDNPEGYERGSVFYHLDRWEGEMSPLLLIHGMADDNVTFDNTTRLMAALQEQGRVFDLMTYPGQRHGVRGQDLRTHLMRTRMAFLDRHLKDD
ncbi:MAG: S9 family peptidase [Pseudomonadota bacterium]